MVYDTRNGKRDIYLKNRNSGRETAKDNRFKRYNKYNFSFCLVIIIAAAVIKFMFPDSAAYEWICRTISGNIDYVSAISSLGAALNGEKSFTQAVAEAYTFAFSIRPEDTEISVETDNAFDNITAEAAAVNIEADDMISVFKKSQSLYSDLGIPENATYDMPDIGMEISNPLQGVVTSSFGYREEVNGDDIKFHYGVDITPSENGDITSISDGTVKATGDGAGYGLYLIVDHGNGVSSLYGHCSEILVSEGDNVEKGAILAKAGSTGNASAECLHFELVVDGVYVNPEYYVSWA